MPGISRVFFLAVFAHIGHRSLSSSGAPLENPFPLGTIGCLASDVCGPQEVCRDDFLFGSCQDVYSDLRGGIGTKGYFNNNNPTNNDKDEADVYHLQTGEIEELEKTIWNLIRDGFTWQDAFTQCTLQNLLVAFKRGYLFSPRLCEDALGVRQEGDWAGAANDEIATVLRELMSAQEGRREGLGDDSVSDLFDREERRIAGPFLDERDLYETEDEAMPTYGLGGEIDLLGSNKRDEFVQVHKYFDKSKGQLKRDPLLAAAMMSDDPYNFIAALPQQDINEGDVNLNSLDNNGLGEELQDGKGLEMAYSPYAPPYGPVENGKGEQEEPGQFFDLPSDMVMPGQDQGEMEAGMESSMAQPADVIPLPEGEGETMEEEEAVELSPRDEATLEQLLEGSVEPDQLPVEQQRRLSRFIETMISMLEMKGTEHTKDVDVVQAGPIDVPPSEDNPIATQVAASRSEDDDDNADAVLAAALKGGVIVGSDGDFEMDKKSPPRPGDEPEDDSNDKENNAVVHTQYTYIKLSNAVDNDQAQQFVYNLTHLLHVPEGVANLNEVNGDQLILKIAQDPQWNSSKLAREAQNNAEALYQETGLKVLDAGIGKGVTVEVEKKDGGYVVLTFILVGSIAGVVLAVTIVYLLKRHRRSRDKLAQLAATGDGNEASKDYQDLCRQRMQAKQSEKPEPLHAATRVQHSSVSESQVRSPSSRSSTSSWSEEPAASNMDISTGHVVLSYMEDHLKNQDRLDQEWEALAAYQADPCNTTIANDASNTRKNRYSDVLPYDHSRVVLSSGTNVNSSDYINASFITDHDPRNPAYICSQGPLPHTVADFWQMVWEQGSVVIVMLTKPVADDNSSLCHRYWPEEGSDLYHIYEVHLVSEHIWCDDYLVRSFYLKNLQTNETRTVTQFHFLTWAPLSVPPSMKALLDFRRKVNKSFRGGSCPIVILCNDGCGRSGTYCLIDMVLNRMAKGAKEIDMAATLEHIRDQRMNMVQTKEQFQFALSAVAEEVHAILKAMPQ